jgi:heme-degrading monooxygenase HmoA
MEKSNQAFTTGVWNVKNGKEKEFIKEWAEFAKWSSNSGNATAQLLQDTDNPSRFISIGKWNNTDEIQKWLEKSEFKDAMLKISNLLAEPAKPQMMKEVAHVGDYITA